MIELKFERYSFEEFVNLLNDIVEILSEFYDYDDCFIMLKLQNHDNNMKMDVDYTIEGSN
jgi:hypothetical protein